MNQPLMPQEPQEPPRMLDALEACLRAVLAWHERPLSSASLRSQTAGGRETWTIETLFEAADHQGYDVETRSLDPAAPSLPPLPAICMTHQGTALALLAPHDEGTVLVVDPEVSEKPTASTFDDVLQRLSGAMYSLVAREVTLAGRASSGEGLIDETPQGQGRYGHWFWGPVGKARWVYFQVGFAALLVNVFALASSVFSMVTFDTPSLFVRMPFSLWCR